MRSSELRLSDGCGRLPEIRSLFLEYAGSLGISLCFQGFEQELASLPGKYAPPRGRLLIADRGKETAGCVAMRPLDQESCEMKRLYVRPAFRGTGLGSLLVRTILVEAEVAGYRAMRLDTLPSMSGAIALYRRLGFRDIPPYCENPVPGAIFLELALPAAARF